MKTFTRAELAACDGRDGRPAYVAYKGQVFDVTASRMWRGGSHMKRHTAGQDLTEEIAGAPHDADVLDRFPRVGVLAEEPAAIAPAPVPAGHAPAPPMVSSIPASLQGWLDRHPFFLRHPHPMTVHFPIVFFIAVPVFTALFLVTGRSSFETTALHCLGAALLFSLVVIPTGLFTWWVNYGAQPTRAVIIKIVLSIAQFLVGLAAFIWRLAEPQVTRAGHVHTIVYLVLLFLPLPMVVVVGWYGATLTFPLRREKRLWRRR